MLARRSLRSHLFVVAALFVLPLVFFWPVTLGDKTLLPAANLYQFLPWAAYPVVDPYQVHSDSLATGPFTSFFTVPGTDTSVVVQAVSPPPGIPKRFYWVKAMLPDTAMFRGDPLPAEFSATY